MIYTHLLTCAPFSAGALTVDLQGCSLQRALVIVVAWLSRAAPLPPDDLPPGRIIIGALCSVL